MQSHGEFAVVTDDFGNAVRYKSDTLESKRSVLEFSIGDLVPYGAQVKSTSYINPYFKEENGVVFVFDAEDKKWIETKNKSIVSLIQFLLKNSWFENIVDEKDWNYNTP